MNRELFDQLTADDDINIGFQPDDPQEEIIITVDGEDSQPQPMADPSVNYSLDGGLEINFEPNVAKDVNFGENLALIIDPATLQGLGAQLRDKIKQDMESREKWLETSIKAVDLLALEIESLPQDLKTPVRVKNSTLKMSWISTVANTSIEMLPPNGPGKVNGDEKDQLLTDISTAVDKDFNNYLTKIDKPFYPDTEQAIAWYVLLGNCFKKVFYDDTGYPISRYVSPENMIVADFERSIDDAERVTERMLIGHNTLRKRIINGVYRSIEVSKVDNLNRDEDYNLTEKVANIAGIEIDENIEDDDIYAIYDCYCLLDLEGYEHMGSDGQPSGLKLPYVVTLTNNGEVLAIYRDWMPNDINFKRKQKFFHYRGAPGLGFYSYGLVHLAGNDANISTMILQQLTLSAQFSNYPAYVRAKGLKNASSNLDITPGSAVELDTLTNLSEMLQLIPTKEPSATLYQLKNELDGNINNYGVALNSKMTDVNPNAPVGTTLAMIEQVMKVPNANIGRLYNVMSNELQHLADLMFYAGYFPYVTQEQWQQLEITSIANPRLSSNIQRSMQSQFVLQIASQYQQFFNFNEVLKFVLTANKIDNIDKLLIEEKKPVALDPINEHLILNKGEPIIADIRQDHEAHIMLHGQELQMEMMKPQPNIFKIQQLEDNIKQHEYYQIVVAQSMQLGQELPHDTEVLANDFELQNMYAKAEAELLQQQLAQAMQAQQPQQPPIDPNMVLMKQVEVEDISSQRKAETERIRAEVELYKIKEQTEMDRLKLEQTREIELAKLQSQAEEKMAKYQLEVEKLAQRLYELENKLDIESLKVENDIQKTI